MVLIHRQNVIHEFIGGETHVKGFLPAYLGLTQGYILLPEYESSKGYADSYMIPNLIRRPNIVCNYIMEMRYARHDTSDADIASLKYDAAERLRRYVDDEEMARTKGSTRLGLITLMSKGWGLVALERLASRADCENASET